MKKLCFMAILLIVIAAYPLISRVATGPRISIEAKEFDFKEVQEGKTMAHTFKVLNKGDQTLEIERINPG